MNNQPALVRYLRRPEVMRKTGLSRTTLYLRERAGDFPKHRMLTPRCAVWLEHEVEQWMLQRPQATLAPWPVTARRPAKVYDTPTTLPK